MKPGQQRIAIARACGEDNDSIVRGLIPDYLNDLNAMHEAEKETDMHYSQKWTTTLCEVMFESTSISVAGATKWDFALLCARSTAAQRAEAFLKTLNLWKQ